MPDKSRNLFPMNNWDSHQDQTHDDLVWGGQLESCKRLANAGPVHEKANDGLPDLDPNGQGSQGYGPRDDLR